MVTRLIKVSQGLCKCSVWISNSFLQVVEVCWISFIASLILEQRAFDGVPIGLNAGINCHLALAQSGRNGYADQECDQKSYHCRREQTPSCLFHSTEPGRFLANRAIDF